MEDDLLEGQSSERRVTTRIKSIIVIRHAESVANTQGIYQGVTYDTDLSPLGKKQAQALAKRLADVGITKIISSPLKRAYQTAMEVSKLTDLPIETNELIIETNHGEWEGRTKEWIEQNYSDIYNAWFTAPSTVAFPKGEAFLKTYDRVNEFLQNYPLDPRTLLVTHDNILRIMVTLANGWTLDEIWRHDIEPAALNFFETNLIQGKNKLNILKLNDTVHLEGLRADINKHAL